MPTVEKFIEQLDAIPWFANLGKSSLRDPEVFRIYNWDTWPGPEDPGSELLSAFHMQWHDELFTTEKQSHELRKAWQTIYDRAFRLARTSVAYDEQQDVWFGPNAAALQAAFTTALVGCTLLRDGELESSDNVLMQWSLSNVWSWYQAGHWPCMYYWSWGHADVSVAQRTGGAKRLVVY